MKNIFKLLFVVFIINGCSNDFIELAPFSQADVDDFFKTGNDFEIAVNAVYDVLQDGRLYGGRFETVLEIRSDNGRFIDPTSERFDIANFTETSDNNQIFGPYVALYQGIGRANGILDRIDQAAIDDATLAERIKGEAQFLRGLFYFHLVQLYGDVPLVNREITASESGDFDREPIDKIYEFIENDLKSAAMSLPVSHGSLDKGRATQGAANGLLAKVYLTQNKTGLAKGALEQVIASGEYSLQPNVAAIFNGNNELNNEILFAVRFTKLGDGEGNSLLFDINGGDRTINQDLIDAYNLLDERLALVEYVTVTGSRVVPKKYFDVLNTSNRGGLDVPVLRYADILLMYAEVLNEEAYIGADDSPAFQNLNTVRERAGLAPYTTVDLVNQVTFRAAVLNERRLELALEFHRWYDLKRTNTVISTFAALGVTVQECNLIYPIPQIVIERAADPVGFPQNPTCN